MGSRLLASMMAGGRGTPLGTREKRFVLSFGFKIESEIRCSRGLSRASSNSYVCVCVCVCEDVCICSKSSHDVQKLVKIITNSGN